jgi:hypothetical protein
MVHNAMVTADKQAGSHDLDDLASTFGKYCDQ